MKYLFTAVLLIISIVSYAQSSPDTTKVDEGVTSIMMVTTEFEHMDVLEEVIETMLDHEAFVDMKRSQMVMTPFGPSQEYKEIIEVRFKNLALVSDWRQSMESQIPGERRALLEGTKVFFYQYK